MYRRLGRVRFSGEFVRSDEFYKVSNCVFSNFSPVDVYYCAVYDMFIYTGASPLFAPVPEGEKIPKYHASIKKDEDGSVYLERFERAG